MKTFLKRLLLLSAVLLAIMAVVALVNEKYFEPVFFAIPIYFGLITLLLYCGVNKVIANNPKRFMSVYMLMQFGEMFLHIVVLFAFVYFNFQIAKMFTIYFVVNYIVYTIFGKRELMKLVKSDAKNNQ
jgi:uncharacterized membrane protein HdeD (DUF308 family)